MKKWRRSNNNSFKQNHFFKNRRNKNKKQLQAFDKKLFLKNAWFCLKFFLLNKGKNRVQLLNVFIYASILIFDVLNNWLKIIPEVILHKEKALFVGNKTYSDYFNFIFSFINYYKKYYIYCLNINILSYVMHSLIILCNSISTIDSIFHISLFNEEIFKWVAVGIWSFCATLFVKKKYKEYKLNNNVWIYNEGVSKWLKIYYKYNGNYKQYLYIKKLLRLNKNFNKKMLLMYDVKKKKFIKKCNIYYDLIMEDIMDNKDIFNISINKEYYMHFIFNSFLKLDSPFQNDDVPFTLYKLDKIKKKKLYELSYLVSYAYIYKKKKKSTLSFFTEDELNKNFLNFYQWTIEQRGLSVLNSAYNEPLIIPQIPYLKFQDTIDFDTIFDDINNTSINDLAYAITKAFDAINESEYMYCVNDEFNSDDIVLQEDPEDNYFKVKTDLSLLIWLNKGALKDKNFYLFLEELKGHYKNISSNILNINLFEESYGDDQFLLQSFLQNNFFYLDYFTLSINSHKYTLCYLLFTYKVLKNVHEYEKYYNTYCTNFIKNYNKTTYSYHKHINKRLKNVTNLFNSFVKYKANNILNNQNNVNIDFLWNIKKKNFDYKYYNKKNISNFIKINKVHSDYQQFLLHFEKYKSLNNFQKVSLENRIQTFDHFMYGSLNVNDLLNSIELKRQKVINLLKYYNYKDNTLINYHDIGLYLYDLEGFEWAHNDTILFFDYKNSDLLNFIKNDDNLLNKKDFQYNYSVLYFHYVIKLLKNLKTYEFSIALENILFNDSSFDYSNFGTSTSLEAKRLDFLYDLEHFLKGFKAICSTKQTNYCAFINNLIFHYGRFIEFINILNFNMLYKPWDYEEEKLFEIEHEIDNIMQVWKHILDKIEDLRTFYVGSINLLKYNKLNEFLDYPMFNNSIGFLKLKEAYFIKMEELIYEDRMLDHIFNITMCLFRTFDKHNTYFRHEILLKNTFFPKLYYLEIIDWEYIFNLEKAENPLIIIELYNSKQKYLKNELWTSSIDFNTIIYNLSYVSAKEVAYGEINEAWENFFSTYAHRDLIIYDLTQTDINKIKNFLELHNEMHFNTIDVEESLIKFLENNLLIYDSKSKVYKKQYKDVKQTIQNNITEDIDITIKTVNIDFEDSFKINKKADLNIKKVNNIEFLLNKNNLSLKNFNMDDNTSFTIFKNIIEYTDIEKNSIGIFLDLNFFSFLKKKLMEIKNTEFSRFLLVSSYTIESEYNTNENIVKYKYNLNYLYYLLQFYLNIIKISNFDNSIIKQVNMLILSNKQNYMEPNKLLNLDCIKDINSIMWDNNSLSKSFNNKNLFVLSKGYNYLNNILYYLNNEDNIGVSQTFIYLINLEKKIIKTNFEQQGESVILHKFFIFDVLTSLFSFINMHIIKINYMLNNLLYIKTIINDIYLDLCAKGMDINNFNIVSYLYSLIYNKKGDNRYIKLINLLLYIKDPIFFFNILSIDLKCYIINLLEIYNIIQKSDMDMDLYLKIFNVLNEDKYQSLSGIKLIYNKKMSNFFKKKNLILLNEKIISINKYALNGYFNLNNINISNLECIQDDNNILSFFNIEKLMIDFDTLFLINTTKALIYYTEQDFFVAFYSKINKHSINEFNFFENFNIKNITDLLINLNLQKGVFSNNSILKKVYQNLL